MAVADDEDFVRSWALAAVGDIGHLGALEFLLRFLDDPSLRVRTSAAMALGELGSPRALEPLKRARRKLRRSPLEWVLYRGAYSKAIDASKRGPDDQDAKDGGAPRFSGLKAILWVAALFVGYKILRLYVGFWWVAVPAVVLAVVIAFLAFVNLMYEASSGPPRKRGRPPR